MVSYFAYGSNMQTATFRGRRGIEPARARVARLDGWRLVIDKPALIPSMGEAFANIVEETESEVFGVVFEITDDDLAHIDLTEGVLIGNYTRIGVPVMTLGDGERLDAETLVAQQRDPDLLPSRRYLSLLVEGAVEHGLPKKYVKWLRSLPARDEMDQAARLRPMIDDAFRRLR